MVEKTCKFCGKKFEAKRVTAEFCSDNHRVQWNNAKKPKPPKANSLSAFLKSGETGAPKEPQSLSYQEQLLRKKLGLK